MPPSGGLHLVQQLNTLPRELVDKIFDNLSLFKVLQLATSADPVITAFILEHRHYGKVFLSRVQLERAVSRFAMWCRVKFASGWRNDRHLFAINPTSSLFGRVTYVAIMDAMLDDIKQGYLRGSKYAQILSQFSRGHVRLDFSEKRLNEDLERLWTAQESIKELESRQLNILADCMETYPQMLRWAHDPRGDQSTTPPEHIIRKLRTCAKKVFNTQYMRARKPVRCMYAFRNGILPLVPRDQYLQLLLQADLPADVVNFETSQDAEVDEDTTTVHSLPLNVTNDLRTVFRGFLHRYARPDHTITRAPIPRISAVRRIKKTKELFAMPLPERRQILYQNPPSFFVPLRSEFRQRAEKKHYWWWVEKQFFSVLPYHQQELEWLRAFLRSVAYLERLDMLDKKLQA
jgi:hypothetical protein